MAKTLVDEATLRSAAFVNVGVPPAQRRHRRQRESGRSYCVVGIVVEYRCTRRHGTAGYVDTRQQHRRAMLPLSQRSPAADPDRRYMMTHDRPQTSFGSPLQNSKFKPWCASNSTERAPLTARCGVPNGGRPEAAATINK